MYASVVTSIIYPVITLCLTPNPDPNPGPNPDPNTNSNPNQVIVHWVWCKHGFMSATHPDVKQHPYVAESVNLIDFAGSGVVHLTGGVCALMGSIFVGPRIGRFPG